MELDWTILRSEEQTMYRLRGLYEKYGYRRFKMSKFEEYDLYVQRPDDHLHRCPGGPHGPEAGRDPLHHQEHPGG